MAAGLGSGWRQGISEEGEGFLQRIFLLFSLSVNRERISSLCAFYVRNQGIGYSFLRVLLIMVIARWNSSKKVMEMALLRRE